MKNNISYMIIAIKMAAKNNDENKECKENTYKPKRMIKPLRKKPRLILNLIGLILLKKNFLSCGMEFFTHDSKSFSKKSLS